MPTYEYRCKKCVEHLEVIQSFSDDPLKVCPSCKGQLQKVFSPVGIVFKGSGFYKTDNRGGKAGSHKAPEKETSPSSKSDSPASTSSSEGSSNKDSKIA